MPSSVVWSSNIDLGHDKRGLGTSLLQEAVIRAIAVVEHAGNRALLTHPLDAEAYALYRCVGFGPTPQMISNFCSCSSMRCGWLEQYLEAISAREGME